MGKRLKESDLALLPMGALIEATVHARTARIVFRKGVGDVCRVSQVYTAKSELAKLSDYDVNCAYPETYLANGDAELFEPGKVSAGVGAGEKALDPADLDKLKPGDLVRHKGRVLEAVGSGTYLDFRDVKTSELLAHIDVCERDFGGGRVTLVNTAAERGEVTIKVPHEVPYGFATWQEVIDGIGTTGKAGRTVLAVAEAVVAAGLDVEPEVKEEVDKDGNVWVFELPGKLTDDILGFVTRDGAVYRPNPLCYGEPTMSVSFYASDSSFGRHGDGLKDVLKQGVRVLYVK